MFYPSDQTPPPEFIWKNLTPYQQHTIKDKWYVYNYVESSEYSKEECYRRLSKQLGKCKEAIKKIYKNISNESIAKKSQELNI